MPSLTQRPLIGLTACLKPRDGSFFHSVSSRYVDAVVTGMEAIPVLMPAIGEAQNVDGLLSRLDGILLTGSPSNVDPALYGGPPPREDNLADGERDATTLPLIQAALRIGMPILAICRGFQELNVALGGTLHQHVHEIAGRFDHRSDKSRPVPERFLPCHPVSLVEGGRLAALLELQGQEVVMVNSLHGQGLDRVAEPLVIEARAEDGTIEAVSMPSAAGFVMGVQWHPEYAPLTDPHSRRLFAAFRDAARTFATNRDSHAGLQRVA